MLGLGQGSGSEAASATSLPDAKGRRFGWVAPLLTNLSEQMLIDEIDLGIRKALPSKVDLRDYCPPIYDQGDFNTCSAHAVAALLQILRKVEQMPEVTPSRLFMYWFARAKTGDESNDKGASIAEMIDSVVDRGYCIESLWGYTSANLFLSPSVEAKSNGATHVVQGRLPVNGLAKIKSSLANHHPVAFGITLYNSFFKADSNYGIVPMPTGEGPSVGHAGLLVGYDDNTKLMIMRNSWGTHTADGTPCGDKGYYYLPYSYVNENPLTADFWTIKTAFQ